ncbi:MAG: adenine deaminase [Stictis urceolatum]|nr:adenine deaminase [Stictis urceolata]
MCHDPLHPFLEALPKVEHHMHLEGALDTSLLFTLAARNKIPLPTSTDPAFASPATLLARYDEFSCLDDFLHFYYLGIRVLLTAQDFTDLTYAYFQRASRSNLAHAELFFDPQAHTSRGIPLSTVIRGINAGRARARSELGISSLLICCFLRHLPVGDCEAAYEEAEPFLASGELSGIGLDSSEKGFPPELFEGVYKRAREAGFGRTAHAGEECGAEAIRSALEVLGVQRVDHGRTLVEDEGLMREVAERGVLVTMCPLSNVRLRGVRRVEECPVRKFLEAGVRFSVNSDDPSYFKSYIQDNYCAVQEAFKLTAGEWVRIVGGSIEGSWCDRGRKDELLGLLKKAQEGFEVR